MSSSATIDDAIANTLVSGNANPAIAPWRKLFAPSAHEVVRIVTTWLSSNYTEAMARFLEAGRIRRSCLIAKSSLYVDKEDFVQFGSFSTKAEALNAFHDGDYGYALHMYRNASSSRVTKQKTREGLDAILGQFHRVVPKEQCSDSLADDSSGTRQLPCSTSFC